eukprot:CAMPEP_0185588336 /NCGR_PEP_ID=MMETSP0434-20130131/52670_1 /TAXON_ID=626734 ORGANISM="Favella taraikaensis, Strain Fe Narragansett Bay" /NCGR_SAMPLE_ID=MMETSP0434 /ASSEMBLY_ACC=CAM_ASM_000379 /LENGTH=39 /DNA_ID= /DNA_START= /DNA_END= /DNA_ORIENTATION=
MRGDEVQDDEDCYQDERDEDCDEVNDCDEHYIEEEHQFT